LTTPRGQEIRLGLEDREDSMSRFNLKKWDFDLLTPRGQSPVKE
jgi:hypothetical protein